VPVTATGQVTVIVAAAGVDPTAVPSCWRRTGTRTLGAVVLGSERRTPDCPEPGCGRSTRRTRSSGHARHLAMSNVEGRFTAFAGQVTRRRARRAVRVAVSIDAASIDTGNAERDAHLRSPDFLDVARFPVLTYRSTRVVAGGGDRYLVQGT
jgi:hypothetical protein